MAQKTVIFCGGGSGGHVMPALAIIKRLQRDHSNLKIRYIGSHNGIERTLVNNEKLPYHSIATGKLRRYFSLQNFIDIFKVIWGTIQSFFILLPYRRKDTLVFSTGGFVTVPVVVAAWIQRKKISVHEQTSRVGLANKIASRFAQSVLISFEESKKYFPKDKTVLSGYPLRDELLLDNGSTHSEFTKPLLFVTGGGNGSALINRTIDSIFDKICDEFYIVHQVGKAFESEYKAKETENYKTCGFIGPEMIDYLKTAKVIISRAGAGTVMEIMALGKPSIFVPLKGAQKNEQLHNAEEAKEKVGSIIIEEDVLNAESILSAIKEIQSQPQKEKTKLNPTDQISNHIIEKLGIPTPK